MGLEERAAAVKTHRGKIEEARERGGGGAGGERERKTRSVR